MIPFISSLVETATKVLGLHVPPDELGFLPMAARSAIVFGFGVLLVRWGDRRLLGKNAGFDMLLVVILGSVLSRGVNGHAAFFPTLGVSAALVFLHHLTGTLAARVHWFSRLLKGMPILLVADGKADEKALTKTRITRDDLEESLRVNGGVGDVARVREARLERNGSISVVPK